MKLRVVIIAFVVAALGGLAGAYAVFRPNLTAVERGRRLAQANGCFACHGPEGIRGIPNPGRDEKTVPTYENDLMMYASDPGEVREWIHDGSTAAKRESDTWNEDRARGVIRMPAYGGRLAARKIDDLVAFVLAVNGQPAPEDSLPLLGRKRAEALGCFGCHGAGGRYARENPGSLKGYIPPWDGPDFPELVQGREEFGEWVEKGVGARFEKNPVAQFFLKRAPVKMRAYKGHLDEGDVDALWAYVTWLRARPPVAPAAAKPAAP
jgi:mono/diheme cytochrome c family protein